MILSLNIYSSVKMGIMLPFFMLSLNLHLYLNYYFSFFVDLLKN